MLKQDFPLLKGSSFSAQVNKSLAVACQMFLGICHTQTNMSRNTSNVGCGQFDISLEIQNDKNLSGL